MVDIDLRSFVLFIALQFEAGLLEVAPLHSEPKKTRRFWRKWPNVGFWQCNRQQITLKQPVDTMYIYIV
jgi:hypothetical protein